MYVFMQVLDNVTWRLHMTLGNQSEAKSTNLMGFFNFATTEVDGSDADSVTVGLTQAQVEKLFEQLQTVQNQVAFLTSSVCSAVPVLRMLSMECC